MKRKRCLQNISEALDASVSILAKHDWCQGAYALNVLDQPVNPTNKTATCFDGLGALRRVLDVTRDHVINRPVFKRTCTEHVYVAAIIALDNFLEEPFWQWQDKPDRTVEEVIAVFKRVADLHRRSAPSAQG